jgi:hypothetical protein
MNRIVSGSAFIAAKGSTSSGRQGRRISRGVHMLMSTFLPRWRGIIQSGI